MKKYLSLILLGTLAASQSVRALTVAETGLGATGEASGLKTGELAPLLGTFINGVFGLLGILFLITTIYGGFRIMLSNGDTDKVKNGRNIILYAVIGMAITLMSFAITSFVFTNIIGVSQ